MSEDGGTVDISTPYRAVLAAGAQLLRLDAGWIFQRDHTSVIGTGDDPPPPDLLLAALMKPLSSSDEPFRAGWPRTFLAAPVAMRGRPAGSACFCSGNARPDFTAEDREMLEIITGILGALSDLTYDFKQLVARDAVTGLASNSALFDMVDHDAQTAAARGARRAAILIDVDEFRTINAVLGHDSGDAVLREIGARLQSSMREGDVVARRAADQFVAWLGGDVTRREAELVAERLRRATVAPLSAGDRTITLAASYGLAMFPEDGRDIHALLHVAEASLAPAKELRRNAPIIAAPAVHAVPSRNPLEEEIRASLEAGHFELHYQPQHDTDTGALHSVEALIRWNHPSRGLLLPQVFVPAAERSDQIDALGDFVLARGCADIAAIRAAHDPNLRLALNLSAQNFYQPRLAEKLVTFAEAANLVPSAVELEITETVAMGDAALTATILLELHELGFALALDDFGTGYSSLGYLRDFPIHVLKIDRSFVRNLPEDDGCVTIVRAVIAMAHALGIDVVAEGVERAEQLHYLRAEHCDRWQGFLYAPALTLADLKLYIAAGVNGRGETNSSERGEFSWQARPSASPRNKGKT
jgi:diguanylate cyclase (GGDEF)-like protein